MSGVMSSNPVMLKRFCLPRCWRGGPGPGRLRSCGLSGSFPAHMAPANDSEVAAWSIPGMSELAAGWGAGAGQEEGPKASKKCVWGGSNFVTQIMIKILKSDGWGLCDPDVRAGLAPAAGERGEHGQHHAQLKERGGGGGGRPIPTWDLKVEVTGAANSGDGGRLPPACDALLHPPLSRHLHREGAPCRTQLPQGPVTPCES